MAEAKAERVEIAVDCPVCHEIESVTYDHDGTRSRVWCEVCGVSASWEEAGAGNGQLSNAAKSWNDLFGSKGEDDEADRVSGS
jgi:transcription elongation factor Elf1